MKNMMKIMKTMENMEIISISIYIIQYTNSEYHKKIITVNAATLFPGAMGPHYKGIQIHLSQLQRIQ